MMNKLKKFWNWLSMSELGDVVWVIFHIPYLLIEYLTKNGYFPNLISDKHNNYYSNRREAISQVVIVGGVVLSIGVIIGILI